MKEIDLLHRLAKTELPTQLVLLQEIALARNLKELNLINAAIPPMKRGRDNYGEQDPAIVLGITQSGRQALAAI